jgi:hypothetical protein
MHKNDEKEGIPKTALKGLGIQLPVEHVGCFASVQLRPNPVQAKRNGRADSALPSD